MFETANGNIALSFIFPLLGYGITFGGSAP